MKKIRKEGELSNKEGMVTFFLTGTPIFFSLSLLNLIATFFGVFSDEKLFFFLKLCRYPSFKPDSEHYRKANP